MAIGLTPRTRAIAAVGTTLAAFTWYEAATTSASSPNPTGTGFWWNVNGVRQSAALATVPIDAGGTGQTMVGDSGTVLESNGTTTFWGTATTVRTGPASARPPATCSGGEYFADDIGVVYVDDVTACAWKGYLLASGYLSIPTAASYATAGKLSLTQMGDVLFVQNYDTAGSNLASTALTAATISSTGAWIVEMGGVMMPSPASLNTGSNVMFGPIVATGTTTSDTGYSFERFWFGSAGLGAVSSTFHPGSTRISTAQVTNTFQQGTLANVGGLVRLRLFSDGSILHLQVGQGAYSWMEYGSIAIPSSLTRYGFLFGEDSSTAIGAAIVYKNQYTTTLPIPQLTIVAPGCSQTSPVVCSVPSTTGLASGDNVSVHGVAGATGANNGAGQNNTGVWPILLTTTADGGAGVSLLGSTATGGWDGGGTITDVSH